MNKKILIVCFDVPYPDNYGGVKDVWSRVQYLRTAGYEIDLLASCTDAERIAAFERETKRIRTFSNVIIVRRYFDWRLLLGAPLPISLAVRGVSRSDKGKLQLLSAERYDLVLVEHLKSLALFFALRSQTKVTFALFRSHNIESEFYRRLAASETFGRKWAFLRLEAILYKLLERRLVAMNWFEKVLYISKSDMQRDESFITSQKIWLPMWMGRIASRDGGEFDARSNTVLYVGNLDSSDNVKSVWEICRMIEPLLHGDGIKLLVIGKRLSDAAMPLPNVIGVQYRFNVSNEDLRAAYKSAKLFFSYSLNEAGVKTKLMDAVMHDLPVVANQAGVKGSGLEDVVYQVGTTQMCEEADVAFLRELILSREAWKQYFDLQKEGVVTFISEVEESYRSVFAT